MDLDIPQASRLTFPEGYQVGAGDEPVLPWSHAVQWLEQARNYLLATTWPDGRPHVAPIWGVQVDGGFSFDGIPTARWARNLAANPSISVHLESGDDVVIFDGTAEDLERVTDAALAARIVDRWETKYGGAMPRPASRGMYRL